MTLELIGAPDEPDLLFLPWHLALEDWPREPQRRLGQAHSIALGGEHMEFVYTHVNGVTHAHRG
jgi:hypothetical protein